MEMDLLPNMEMLTSLCLSRLRGFLTQTTRRPEIEDPAWTVAYSIDDDIQVGLCVTLTYTCKFHSNGIVKIVKRNESNIQLLADVG